VRTGAGLTFFEFLGTEFESTDYTRVIERREGRQSLLQQMLAALVSKEPRLDVLHLSNILDSDETLDDLRRYSTSVGASYEQQPFRLCPIIHIRSSWDTFVEGLSPKMRKNVRRATRQLLDAGAEFKLVTDRAEVRPGIRELFALHADRFVMKNAKTGFRADLREPFHAAVAEQFFDSDILRLFRLELQGRVVATVYCFEHGGGLFYFQGGMDP
jgi:CelD/BcsL family acetyltransferase involved in cellulose biosynthesis